MLTKKKYKRANPIKWGETKCCICNFDLGAGVSNGRKLDFVIKKVHAFIRYAIDSEHLTLSDKLKTLETYFEKFKLFLQIVAIFYNAYNNESDIDDITHSCIADFVSDNQIESFEEFFLEVSNTQVKNISTLKKTKVNQIKLISFVSDKIMQFPNDEFDANTLVTRNFSDSVLNLLFAYVVIHHSHISGEIIGYSHDFCNRRLRENQSLKPLIAHNLFRLFRFFLCSKRNKALCLEDKKIIHRR